MQHLLEEVLIRHTREEQERKVLEEFYKPPGAHHGKKPSRQKELERVGELDEEPSGELNTSANPDPAPKENVEVLNFEELMSQEEEAAPERTEEDEAMHQRPQALNEIAEEAMEDQNSPMHPSRLQLE